MCTVSTAMFYFCSEVSQNIRYAYYNVREENRLDRCWTGAHNHSVTHFIVTWVSCGSTIWLDAQGVLLNDRAWWCQHSFHITPSCARLEWIYFSFTFFNHAVQTRYIQGTIKLFVMAAFTVSLRLMCRLYTHTVGVCHIVY